MNPTSQDVDIPQQSNDIDPLLSSTAAYQFPRKLDQFDQPMEFYCTHCQQNRVSVLRYENGKYTWICCCVLCVFAGVMAFLPFYVKDCKDVEHFCPACSLKVGFKQFKAC